MSGLARDIKQVLMPLRALATHLSMAQGELIEAVCADVIAICEDEERQSQVLVDEFNKLQDEMEDR